MRGRLRRLWAPESLVDDAFGGALAGAAIAVAFRFVFGDDWPVALGAGAFAFAAATFFGWQGRSVRRSRAGE